MRRSSHAVDVRRLPNLLVQLSMLGLELSLGELWLWSAILWLLVFFLHIVSKGACMKTSENIHRRSTPNHRPTHQRAHSWAPYYILPNVHESRDISERTQSSKKYTSCKEEGGVG